MLKFQRQDDGSYLVMAGQRVLDVNEEALTILREAYRGESEGSIARTLSEKFSVSPEEAARWIEAIKDQLSKEDTQNTDELKLKAPLAVQWRVTNRCNLNCRHCYIQPRKYHGRDELTPYERKTIAKKLIEGNVFSVLFTGGECLLLPDTVDLMRMLFDEGMELKIFTNALLVPRYLGSLLSMKDRLVVNVSVDGDREHHELVRGPNTFAPTLRAIEQLTRAGVKVVTNTVLTRLNFRSLPQLMEDLTSVGVHSIQFSHMAPHGNAQENRADLQMSLSEYDEFEHILREAFARYRQAGVKSAILYRPLAKSSDTGNGVIALEVDRGEDMFFEEDWTCAAGRTRITIDPLGDVIPCSFLSGRFSMGNLVTQGLEEVWRSPVREGFVDYVRGNSRSRMCAAFREMSRDGERNADAR